MHVRILAGISLIVVHHISKVRRKRALLDDVQFVLLHVCIRPTKILEDEYPFLPQIGCIMEVYMTLCQFDTM